MMQSTDTEIQPIDLLQWTELVERAPADGSPCIAASSTPEGYPDMSFKGSLMVLDQDHLAWWEWSMGEQLKQIEESPRVSVLYRNPGTRVFLRWYGTAELLTEGDIRAQVMARTPQRELDRDPDRKGIAVRVRVDMVRQGGKVVQQRL